MKRSKSSFHKFQRKTYAKCYFKSNNENGTQFRRNPTFAYINFSLASMVVHISVLIDKCFPYTLQAFLFFFLNKFQDHQTSNFTDVYYFYEISIFNMQCCIRYFNKYFICSCYFNSFGNNTAILKVFMTGFFKKYFPVICVTLYKYMYIILVRIKVI